MCVCVCVCAALLMLRVVDTIESWLMLSCTFFRRSAIVCNPPPPHVPRSLPPPPHVPQRVAAALLRPLFCISAALYFASPRTLALTLPTYPAISTTSPLPYRHNLHTPPPFTCESPPDTFLANSSSIVGYTCPPRPRPPRARVSPSASPERNSPDGFRGSDTRPGRRGARPASARARDYEYRVGVSRQRVRAFAVCVRACVRARVRACVRACACGRVRAPCP